MLALSARELRDRRLAASLTLLLGRHWSRLAKKKSLPRHINKILFFKFGALGDVLMTTPLVRAVREKFPNATLHYCVGEWSAPALENNPHISKVIPFTDSIVTRKRVWSLLRTLRKLRHEKYDVVFVLDRAWQAGVLSATTGGFTIGFDRLGEGFALHATIPYGHEPHETAPHDIDTYLALGNKLGCPTQPTQMEFAVTPAAQQWAHAALGVQRPVALCPGGARNPYQEMPARRWPLNNFISLGRHLAVAGWPLIILGGKDDAHDAKVLYEALVESGVTVKNFCGRTNLNQAGALLKQCAVVVVADTALVHLSGAVSTPTVALFGPTNPHRKAPVGTMHQIIWKAIPCPTCGQSVCHWERRPPHPASHTSMAAITVAEVYECVQRVLLMPDAQPAYALVSLTIAE